MGNDGSSQEAVSRAVGTTSLLSDTPQPCAHSLTAGVPATGGPHALAFQSTVRSMPGRLARMPRASRVYGRMFWFSRKKFVGS